MILRAVNPGSFVLVMLILFSMPMLAQEGLPVGSQAPDFNLPTLDGTRIALSTFADKNIVVLHFWKTR